MRKKQKTYVLVTNLFEKKFFQYYTSAIGKLVNLAEEVKMMVAVHVLWMLANWYGALMQHLMDLIWTLPKSSLQNGFNCNACVIVSASAEVQVAWISSSDGEAPRRCLHACQVFPR